MLVAVVAIVGSMSIVAMYVVFVLIFTSCGPNLLDRIRNRGESESCEYIEYHSTV